ncbi:OmpA family protein [Parvularcula lutaonensis]|uniref:OmpA family protein n=1 Tax=Parvularcula lutaonensis TaxID=491923 RepID=A0ABV7MF35_9PROT|nr:OmpA family protein [Parvularcula lutaonensis]GGY53353.1 membrane protein [Parvularcula lutaonensis]
MSYRLALLVAVGTAALGTASAQTAEKEGHYGALGVGYAYEYGANDFQSEEGALRSMDAQEFDSRLETGDGFAAYAALGKYFQRGLRGEIELSHRSQDVNDLPGDGAMFAGFRTGGNGQNVVNGTPLGDNNDLGTFGVTAGMVNLYKDFNFDAAGRFTPYIGAGIGFAKVRADFDNVDDQPAVTDAQVMNATRPVSFRILASNDDYVTAVQGLAGISFALTDDLSFDLGYRYLRTGEYDFDAYVNNEVTAVTGEYEVHETTFGLRWDFGAGAPVAAPAVQPTPQTKTCFDGTVVPMGQDCPTAAEDEVTPEELRTVVYFEFDSAELSPAARQLLQRRAQQATDLDIIEVVVSGHTDTSGSASYNERLSARRAQVVRDALVSYGIDADKIKIRALGETKPAKPTPDGVREPLNRRTEVEFDF